MQKTKYVVSLALLILVIIAVSLPLRAVASTTYASDTFARTSSNSWGSAGTGGAYSLSGTAANFDVSQVGMITFPSANLTQSAYLASVSVRDVDVKLRIKRDKVPAGGSHIGYFVARRISNGNNYLGRIRYAKDGSVRIQAVSEVSGAQTMLGSEVAVAGLTTAANAYIWLRGQVTAANPTTIRLKAWAQGQSEPGSWQYTVTDSSTALQGAGGVGLRGYLATGSTNAPVMFYFDDFTVTDTSTTQPTPTPTSAPRTATPNPTATPIPPTPTPAPSGPSIYWGALVNGQAPSSTNLATGGVFDKFEQNAGKQMAILHWGAPWQMNNTFIAFQTSYYSAVRSRGSIPMVDWSSWNLGSGLNQPNFQSNDITAGTYDSFIRQWATDAKAWGHPFFLRFDWEMNGNWLYSWSDQLNGNSPGDFIKMWRHVHDIFAQVGATNVSWVWCPNISSGTTVSMASVYPGDAYVDWTCIDGYNKYTTWLTFPQVFNGVGITWLGQSYNEITALAPTKPLMIGETASLEAGDGGTKKGGWLKDMLLTQIPYNYPKIKAIVYFNWNDNNTAYTFPIESSAASIAGFKQGIQASFYPANIYSNLNTSPIPALR